LFATTDEDGMTHSDSLANLAGALVLAQGEIENASKNAKNPHFKSTYADLAEIINTVRPTLTKHGLSVVQFPGFAEGVVTVETMLLHKSGEWIKGEAGAPASKQDAQGVGSAVTYLRRYSLAAVCAIAQEDDDGNAVSSRNGGQSEPRYQPVKGGVVDTDTGEVTPNATPIATQREREMLERYVLQFVDVEGMTPAEKKNLTVATNLVSDENAQSKFVQEGIKKLDAMLNKYKPLPPIEAELRTQSLELGEMANANG
jgi:hypothetical protein